MHNHLSHLPYTGGTVLNSLASPMTPQATLAPEFPVFSESGWSVFPKSSSWAWTTTDLPTIEYSPYKEICLSIKHIYELPKGSAIRLPKSPTCRS